MQAFLGNGLKDVPRPPSAWPTTCSFSTYSSITRISNSKNYVLTIPMKDYGRITTADEQQTYSFLTKSICPDDASCKLSTSNKTVYNYAVASDNAFYSSSIAGKLSANGCHVGKGDGGPDCYSGGYQSGQELGIYNDTSQLGYSTAVDDFGGLNHDSMVVNSMSFTFL